MVETVATHDTASDNQADDSDMLFTTCAVLVLGRSIDDPLPDDLTTRTIHRALFVGVAV